ncbi:MAG: hypothetical protein ACREM3_09045 [Candidatus Rokuibacteriota bacterium]
MPRRTPSSPTERPEKSGLAPDLETARAPRLTGPPSPLARAGRVVE